MTGHLPCSAGVGLKSNHFEQALASGQIPTWFEVHAENCMGDGGPTHRWLDRVRAEFPLSVHGVGQSIGSANGLDLDHLERLRRVVRRFEPAVVSEHLAWSTHNEVFFNDLLPLPYDDETLDRVCQHIDLIQSFLGRDILLENPSNYLQFAQSEYSEPDFLGEISRRTGCWLLLDINNIIVSASNQGHKGKDYLSGFPLDRVVEIHLAGHALHHDEDGASVLIDTHDRVVSDDVWALYRLTLQQTGPVPTLIEWDAKIPEWPVLAHQAQLANQQMAHLETESPHAVPG